MRRQSDQKYDKLIAMAISPCTEKEELRTAPTDTNAITCSAEYQDKMKGQSTGNQKAEITSIRLLFHFAIRSKLPQTHKWMCDFNIYEHQRFERELFQLKKKCCYVYNYLQYGKCLYRNDQLNVLFKISLCLYHIINAVSQCYTKQISYFCVYHFPILGYLKRLGQ